LFKCGDFSSQQAIKQTSPPPPVISDAKTLKTDTFHKRQDDETAPPFVMSDKEEKRAEFKKVQG
jgi:hypothetical protein